MDTKTKQKILDLLDFDTAWERTKNDLKRNVFVTYPLEQTLAERNKNLYFDTALLNE